MRFKMTDRLFEGGDCVTEMMQTSPAFHGAGQFTPGPIRRDQFQVGPLSRKLEELDVGGLQRIVDHERRETVSEATAVIFGCGLD